MCITSRPKFINLGPIGYSKYAWKKFRKTWGTGSEVFGESFIDTEQFCVCLAHISLSPKSTRATSAYGNSLWMYKRCSDWDTCLGGWSTFCLYPLTLPLSWCFYTLNMHSVCTLSPGLSHELPVGCLQPIPATGMDIWPTPGYISKTDNPNEKIPLFTPEKYNFIGLILGNIFTRNIFL